MRMCYSPFALVIVLAAPLQGQVTYDELLNQAKDQLHSSNNERALRISEQALSLNKDRWEAYVVAGGALMALKRYEQAEDDFSKAIELAPETKKTGLRDLRRSCVLAENESSLHDSHVGTKGTKETATVSQAEVILWKSIEKTNDPESLRAYLQQYPEGAFANLAKTKLSRLDAAAEQSARDAAVASTDVKVVADYIHRFPEGPYAPEARARLPTLDMQALIGALANTRPIVVLPEGTAACHLRLRLLDNAEQQMTGAQKSLIYIPFIGVSAVGMKEHHIYRYVTVDLDLRSLLPEAVAVAAIPHEEKKRTWETGVLNLTFGSASQITLALNSKNPLYSMTDSKFLENAPSTCIQGDSVLRCMAEEIPSYRTGFATPTRATAEELRALLFETRATCPSLLARKARKDDSQTADVTATVSNLIEPDVQPGIGPRVDTLVTRDLEHSSLYIYRVPSGKAGAYSPVISIDGVKIAAVANGALLHVSLPPGMHTILVDKVDVPSVKMEAAQEYWMQIMTQFGLGAPHVTVKTVSSETGRNQTIGLQPQNLGDIK